jgi:hypothetical protein
VQVLLLGGGAILLLAGLGIAVHEVKGLISS